MIRYSEKELFESVPVPEAVLTLAIPTIISQIVTMIYNLADTFFIGRLGDPFMVAAISLVSPWFNLLTALGNLFGIGSGSLISRMMGRGDRGTIRGVSSFGFWGGCVATLLFSICTFLFRSPLLAFLGSSPDTYQHAETYLLWVVSAGGLPTMIGLVLGHMLRSEGHSAQASAGMMLGGILNVLLDPVLIFGFRLDVAGAAIATALSNLISFIFLITAVLRLRNTSLSLAPSRFTLRHTREIFSVGLASALATALGNLSNMTMMRLASCFSDIAVAACGIVKRIDQFPLNISMGLCQGFMPLVGYNYASGNHTRMKKVSYFSWKAAILLSAFFVALFYLLAPELLHLFMPEERTSSIGAAFLRIACLAVPLTAVNFLISYTLQAMGKGIQSATLTFCRQGLLNIPLLILLSHIGGMYWMMGAQLCVELIMLPVSLMMYSRTLRKSR